MIETKCHMCTDGIVFSIKGNGKFCDDCKVARDKARKLKYGEKIKKEGLINKKKRDRLTANFNQLNPSGLNLFPKHFNQISSISSQSYMKVFKLGWLDVLEIFSKKNEAINIMLDEYYKIYLETGNKSLGTFLKDIGVSYSHITENEKNLFWDKVQMNSRTIKDIVILEENFNNVKKELGKIPLYSEFIERTKYPIGTYANKLGFKGKVYDEIVKYYVSDEEFKIYKEEQQVVKSQIGRNNHQGYKYTDEDLEREFRRVFDSHIELTGNNPSTDTFNLLSNIDDSVYRKRHNISFAAIIEKYGYEIDNSHRTEYATIESFNTILEEKAEHQKQFDWLLSDKQYPLRCDAYYPSYSLIVEYDGEQHFKPIEHWGGQEAYDKVKVNDQIKNTLIPQHNLTLLRIAYDEPYYDLDFLKFRLLEHGAVPPKHQVLNDSKCAIKKVS